MLLLLLQLQQQLTRCTSFAAVYSFCWLWHVCLCQPTNTSYRRGNIIRLVQTTDFAFAFSACRSMSTTWLAWAWGQLCGSLLCRLHSSAVTQSVGECTWHAVATSACAAAVLYLPDHPRCAVLLLYGVVPSSFVEKLYCKPSRRSCLLLTSQCWWCLFCCAVS